MCSICNSCSKIGQQQQDGSSADCFCHGGGYSPKTDHRNLSERYSRVQTSAQVMENVLEIGSTLVRVLINCGIHSCKALKALDVIIYSFIFFEETRDNPRGKVKRKIRKTEFINDLIEQCGMTKSEARMTYSVTKAAFQAFYGQKVVTKYDAGEVDPCEWKKAVDKTVDAFCETGARSSEVQIIANKITRAYNDYLCRRHKKKRKNLMEESSDDEKNAKVCPYCCCCQTGMGAACSSKPRGCGPTPREPKLEAQFMGEFCRPLTSPSCTNDTCANPVIVRDCLKRIYLMVQGNKVYFDPEILINEAKRFTPEKSNECGPCE